MPNYHSLLSTRRELSGRHPFKVQFSSPVHRMSIHHVHASNFSYLFFLPTPFNITVLTLCITNLFQKWNVSVPLEMKYSCTSKYTTWTLFSFLCRTNISYSSKQITFCFKTFLLLLWYVYLFIFSSKLVFVLLINSLAI